MKRIAQLLFFLVTTTIGSARDEIKPIAFLSAIEGSWSGTLQYRDYSPPHGLVTLPTQLTIVLTAPNAIALHYIYDDGPGKTVHSYENLQFDLAGKTVRSSDQENPLAKIVVLDDKGEMGEIITELEAVEYGKKEIIRHQFHFESGKLIFGEEEGADQKSLAFRNRYEFQRAK